eukprot:186660-Rhodomonas_salina.1
MLEIDCPLNAAGPKLKSTRARCAKRGWSWRLARAKALAMVATACGLKAAGGNACACADSSQNTPPSSHPPPPPPPPPRL